MKTLFCLTLITIFSYSLFIGFDKLVQHSSKPTPVNPINLKEEYNSNLTEGVFNNKKISIPQDISINNQSAVLGDNISNKRIEIDLTNQQIYGYEDNNQVFNFLISSGKWNSTPNGTFKIWIKIKSQKMSGGSKLLGTYYYLPNVPYIMFFYNETTPKRVGYAIHGTYWHNNFGTPMSHGCINMKTQEAAIIYNWADTSTPIIITGKYTKK